MGSDQNTCCDKTGFCSGNADPVNDTICSTGYTDKGNKATIMGSDQNTCCDKIPEPKPKDDDDGISTITIVIGVSIGAVIIVWFVLFSGVLFSGKTSKEPSRESTSAWLLSAQESLLPPPPPPTDMFAGMTKLD